VQDSGIHGTVSNEGAATLLLDADEFLHTGLDVDVAEVDVVKFHATEFFKLLLHTTAAFEGVV
jgi:hypothetical protein